MLKRVIQTAAVLSVLASAACAPQVIQPTGPVLGKKMAVTATAPEPAATAPVYTPPPAAPADPAFTPPGPGWVEAGVAETFVRFLHLSTVRTVGPSRVQAWFMQNYLLISSRTGSARTLYEFDCYGRTFTIVSDGTYTRHNASGPNLTNFDIPRAQREVRVVPPGSVGEVGFLLACRA